MKKKKNKKRNQKFAERPGANLPSSQELTEAPLNEPIRNDPHSERVDDEFEDDQRWIAVTPPDPWYSPHFWAISVEDPSAERMRETLIAANVLRVLAPCALLTAFAPISLVSRVGCVFIALVFFAVGAVAANFGRRALVARKKHEFDDAARFAKIAKYGLVGLHAALIVVALVGAMAAVWVAFVALGNSGTEPA